MRKLKSILTIAAALACGGAWADYPNPVFLVNFTSDPQADVEGWYDHYQNGGNWLGGEGGITENNIKFSTSRGGNFNPYSAVNTDYSEGTYLDVAGVSHTSLMEEVQTSLGLDAVIPESVYKTGLMNGGQRGHTATISGLDSQKRYVAYFGYGVCRTDQPSYAGGFQILKGGCASFAKLEYVATVKGYNWMAKTTEYTSFDVGTDVKPGQQGLMLVRATDIVPTEEGKIEFVLGGDHAGMNFLAIAELGLASDTSIQATVEGGELSWDDLVWKRGGVVCEAPEASDDCEIVVAADTQISIPAPKAVRALTVSGEGVLQLGMPESRQLTVAELIANTDVRFEPATLAPGLVTIGAEKTVQYYMYSDATIPGICGPGTFEAFVGTEETLRTLTLTRNATINATVSGATVKVHYGTLHIGEARLVDTRFDLDDGTQITQYGWAGISGTLEVFVDEGKSARAFTQSKINAEGQSTFKKTGAGTLEMNAAICTTIATVQEGTLVLATANGWQHTAAISSTDNGRLVKKGDPNVANFAGALNLHGGLEIQESGRVVLSSGAESVIFGVKGPGELTLSGNGALSLGRWKGDAANTASVTGSVITVESSTLRFGNGGVQDGSMLRDCTINFNGGNATAYGWITLNGTVVVNAAQDCTMTANANNRTQGSGTLVKRGTGTLQWNSNIDTAVTIEDGTLDKVTDKGFTIGDAVSVRLEGIEAKLTVPEAKTLTNIGTSLVKYRVVRSVEEGVATYSLEKRGGFTIQIM